MIKLLWNLKIAKREHYVKYTTYRIFYRHIIISSQYLDCLQYLLCKCIHFNVCVEVVTVRVFICNILRSILTIENARTVCIHFTWVKNKCFRRAVVSWIVVLVKEKLIATVYRWNSLVLFWNIKKIIIAFCLIRHSTSTC